MAHTGGLFALIGKRQSRAAPKKPEENKYAICSKFPDPTEIKFDEELGVHLMDGYFILRCFIHILTKP